MHHETHIFMFGLKNEKLILLIHIQVRIQRGDRGPDPPGKSQVIWFSIGNKQLDPPGKSWTPLENFGPPIGPPLEP